MLREVVASTDGSRLLRGAPDDTTLLQDDVDICADEELS